MITHIAYNDKFISDFIDFNQTSFGKLRQRYWIIQHPIKYKKSSNENIYYTGKGKLTFLKDFLVLLYFLITSKKIILHGMPGRFTHLALFLCPWVLRKCYWLIWGAEIYDKEQLRSLNIINKIDSFIYKFVIRNIGYLVSYIKSDIDFAR